MVLLESKFHLETGLKKYDIKAVDLSGEQEKSISMKFDRTTPLDDTNDKDNAETEWF